MRVVGLDLGARRIGVAVSDPSGTIASPVDVLERTGDAAADQRRLAALVRELGAERVIVGLPLSLSGDAGPAARATLAEVEAMAEALGVPVETHDERLSTVSAHSTLRALEVKRAARRRTVDKVAAAVILQSWLDGHRR